ncbi:MAG TPA: O-acetyl-ADP-ribose deacetylase [Planctomycetaceae bacterium]|nr:O-acetyl-ADP-ribose deacetylase [Planctomycetaceae bacterium]
MKASTLQRMRLVQADITTLAVDAIVTAANEALCGGGGVDGAIHRAAGPGLLEECRTLGTCNPGEARITGGYLLPARHIIHTVGPVWDGGGYGEADTLRSCYRESLKLAAENNIGSIAFPCIATGVYLYPKAEACLIAVESVSDWLARHDLPHQVIFCCFEDEDVELYRQELQAIVE